MTDYLLVLICTTIFWVGVDINNSINGKPPNHLETLYLIIFFSIFIYILLLGSQDLVHLLIEVWEKR
mgnify:CR=1 FL=1